MALIGKISRLPANLRNEVCLRLYNGETSAQILPFLNGRADVAKILEAHFNSEPISPQNLSSWKQNEYVSWLNKRQRIEDTMLLSDYASKLAANGKHLATGGATILSGKILEVLDKIEDFAAEDPEQIILLANALGKLQSGEIATAKLNIEKLKLKQSGEKLELEKKKFQRTTVELFIKFCEDAAAKSIALSGESKSVKMEKLVTLMFGKAPEKWTPN